jgi:uncharacterized protein DUF4154
VLAAPVSWARCWPRLPPASAKRTLLAKKSDSRFSLFWTTPDPGAALLASHGREERLNEYQARASFLAAFPKSVGCPPDALSAWQSPLLLCVFGDYSFGTSLAEAARETSIRRRRAEVRWAPKEQHLRACHILFVSRSEGSPCHRLRTGASRTQFKSSLCEWIWNGLEIRNANMEVNDE